MIRPAVAADVLTIADLEVDNLGADAWPEGLIEAGIDGDLPTVRYLVAEVDGEVVGHATASIIADNSELQRITVNASHRRAGVGGDLLAEVVRLALEEGADRLFLDVREDNHGALAFYAAVGFEEIYRRRRYYRDGATAVVLRKELGA